MADIDEVDASADEVAGDATSKSSLFLASPVVRLQALGGVGEMELNDEVDAAAHRVAGLSLSRTSAETASTRISVSSVLDNDDILREILLRLRFSICLVRAALVCKGWLLIIYDPDFLHHFHNLHPPTLLGFYLVADGLLQPRFVSVEDHPPELGLILGRASTYFDTWVDVPVTIWDCRNDQLLIDVFDKLDVQSPLNPRYGIAIYPQSPLKVCLDPAFRYNVLEFLPENGGRGVYYRLAIGYKDDSIIASLFLLEKGIWEVNTSELTNLPVPLEAPDFLVPYGVLIHGRMFMMTNANIILVLDVESLCLTLVDLVDEMKVPTCDDFDISEAESDNEFCLLCLHQSVLRIWYHNMQSSVWHFAASIDLHEVFQRSSTLGSDVSLRDFGLYGALNSKLILVSANDYVCLFNVKENTATKVCQISEEDGNLLRIFPCTMIWPPAFPSELIRHFQLERQLLLEVLGADGQSSRRDNINRFSPLVAFEVNDISWKQNVQRLTTAVGDFGVIISDKKLGLQQLSDSVEKESPNDVVRGKSIEEPQSSVLSGTSRIRLFDIA